MTTTRRRRRAGAKTARFEIRLTPDERKGLTTAAEADGLDASTWARRVLREAAAERIARAEDADREPTEADLAAALAARGSISDAAARRMREVLRRAREEWRGKP